MGGALTIRILAVVPARSGSLGLPGKNTRPMLGKSLIQRAFDCVSEAGVADRIILSTDSLAIREMGGEFGLEAPFLRPAELARDETPMIDVLLHALDFAEGTGEPVDALLLVQPTSPLRRPEHLRRAVDLLGDNDSVCSVVPLPRELCPHYVMRIDDTGYLDYFLADGRRYTRRQDVPQAYRRDGTVYLTRTEVLRRERNLYGDRCVPLLIDPADSVSIDTQEDWDVAEQRLRERSAGGGTGSARGAAAAR